MESKISKIDAWFDEVGRQLPITEFAHKTTVIGDTLVLTVITLLDVTTKGGGSTEFDRGHGATLRS